MKRLIIAILSVFILSFLYLHQKISLSRESYKLSRNWRVYNELVAKRDALLYNFSREVSLNKINIWAKNNLLKSAKRESVLAFYKKKGALSGDQRTRMNLLAQRERRLFNLPGEENVLARDEEVQ